MKQELKQAFQGNARRNTVLYAELANLLEIFSAHNIPVLALKGAHLAPIAYGDIRLRTMSDIDLLIPQNEIQRADDIMLGVGAAPYDKHRVIGYDNLHFLYSFLNTAFIVEIHWNLHRARDPFQVDAQGLWIRAQRDTIAKHSVFVLSPEDLLEHLCLHAAKDAYQLNLRSVCDMDAVVRKYAIEWQTLVARAREWKTTRAAYLFLRLTSELLGAPIPLEILDALEPKPFDARVFEMARAQILAGEMRMDGKLVESPYLAVMFAEKSLRVKARVFSQRLFPTRQHLARMHPARAGSWKIFLYYPVFVQEVAVKFTPYLWRMALGATETRALTARTNAATQLREWLLQA